jgi:hypothetical protein
MRLLPGSDNIPARSGDLPYDFIDVLTRERYEVSSA